MFKAASACSTQTNATSAATECVAQVAAAGIARPDFVVVHANCALSLQEIGRVLRMPDGSTTATRPSWISVWNSTAQITTPPSTPMTWPVT
jgi:hypothetical protein